MPRYKYKHYPIEQAHTDYKIGQKKRYRVTSINWTYGTESRKVNHSVVHRNEYTWTLRQLIKFIVDVHTMGIAEDVIAIEPESSRMDG